MYLTFFPFIQEEMEYVVEKDGIHFGSPIQYMPIDILGIFRRRLKVVCLFKAWAKFAVYTAPTVKRDYGAFSATGMCFPAAPRHYVPGAAERWVYIHEE